VLPVLAAMALIAGLWQVGQGLYIHVKAELAQVLIERAWKRTLAGEREVRPWPWADTWPVARLVMARPDVDVFVLAGANGRTMAFGPGHRFGTPLPGESGNSVVGGHRDTHLSFLRDVRRGAVARVQRQDGAWTSFRVEELHVVDKRDAWLMADAGATRLTLVTCYPFDALRAGGPQRYVVVADAT
jgi:sortase A